MSLGTGCDLREQFGGQMQVMLRPYDRQMTHIGRQHWQLGVKVRALTVPTQQAVHGEGMSVIPIAE